MDTRIGRHIRSLGSDTAPWLLCVSGGADSVALLHAAVRGKIPSVVAHCNFGLRGDESDRDEMFVRSLCHSLGVECRVRRFPTLEFCRRYGLSVEMGCRRLRYAWFRSLRSSLDLKRIVVAHNADDDTETMLLNLLRGTGINGLTGMCPDTGEILRPLLGFSRADILEYLQTIGATHITDSSNLSVDYKRNFLRNEILPALRTRWPGLDKTLARTRSHLRQTAAAERALLRESLPSDTSLLPAHLLASSPAPQSLVHLWLEGHGATPTQVADMCNASPGAAWTLADARVEKTSRGLYLCPYLDTPVPSLCITRLEPSAATLAMIASNRDERVCYCAPAEGLHMRPARPADRITPFGMKGSTPVKKVLKEHGLPPMLRNSFMLLADDADRPVWLPGIRRSALYPVRPDSPVILQISLRP